MEENILRDKVSELFNQKKFDEIIELLKDELLEKEKDIELYVWRGNTWYNKMDYNKAITDYNRVLDINPEYELAFYNRGIAWVAKGEYVDAIADFDKVIEFNPSSTIAYVSRGSIRRVMEEYDKAIADYNKAIDIDANDANAYYNRGLAKKENNIDPEGSRRDFERYLKLTTDENDIWAKYAKNYIKVLNEINDKELTVITEFISKIKNILLIEEDCITHYTSLSVLKSLILDSTKFRISEGNFMNDTSEGIEFFNFLGYKYQASYKNESFSEDFSPKPFIGSFVTKDKHDDLNMWRFYGKEEGVEAKGCAITLRKQEFIDDIKSFLSNEKIKEARLDDENEIYFYQVVYVVHDEPIKFHIPNSVNSLELGKLMIELKEKVNSYKGDNKTSLENKLNTIAFLFKSDAYKNENEVRLVVKGIEFEKGYKMDVSSPKVYIELVPIKDIVTQITLGPKVDKVSEWIAAFHYRYEEKVPKIMISHLPYK